MQYSPESGVEIPDNASDSSRSQTPQLTAPTVGPTGNIWYIVYKY